MEISGDLIKILVAIILAILGIGIVLKFTIKKKSSKNSGSVNIKDSNVRGDVAGRDIKKNGNR